MKCQILGGIVMEIGDKLNDDFVDSDHTISGSELPDISNKIMDELLNYRKLLQKLIDDSNEYYSVLHERIPSIERNIELTKQETDLLMEYFVKTGEDDDTNYLDGESAGDFLIIRILKELETEFENIGQLLLDQGEIEKVLESFTRKQSDKNTSFDQFMALVSEMRKILLRVDEISYNAIIFSSRLGNEGKGFNVISDNLKKTSTDLKTDLSRINESIKSLDRWYKDFNDNISDILNEREQAVEQFINKLDNYFGNVLESMKSMSQLLYDLLSNSMESVSPFQELMTSIQRQDIIRQNLENLIEIIDRVSDKYGELQHNFNDNSNREYIMDHVVFVRRGLELASGLESNVTEQLKTSLSEIITISDELLNDLGNIKSDAQYVTGFLSGDVGEEGAIDYTFRDLTDFLGDFTSVLDKIKESVTELQKQKGDFNSTIEALSHDIEQIYKRVGFLKKIRMYGRIELSRLDDSSKAIGDNIDTVIDQVDAKVSDNKKVFGSMKQNLISDLDNFDQVIIESQSSINESLEKVKYSQERLTTTSEIINKAVMALYKEIENLYSDLEKIKTILHVTDVFDHTISQMNSELESANHNALQVEGNILSFYGVESWEEQSEELRNLFNRFTTYLERVTAKGVLTGEDSSEFDEGSEEGELTLF